ncbi:MAG: PCP reductase family protein [Thermostichales cyanobacterium SZTDM-1c_bins_54]
MDEGSPIWTAEAEAMLRNIPFFARPQARQNIEKLALERHCEYITPELVEEARRVFGQ